MARRIVYALRRYRLDAEADISRWERDWARLPPRHQALLSDQPAHLAAVRQCVCNNQLFILEMLSSFDVQTNPDAPSHLAGANEAANDYAATARGTSPVDIDKVATCSEDDAGFACRVTLYVPRLPVYSIHGVAQR